MGVIEVAVRYRILGPLEVEVDGAPVALGGSRPRALLAALLVHRGTVVSTDRLAEAVWGDSPPRGATSALRAYVSRLRVGLDAQDRLRYRPPGYVLEVPDDEVDAAEFERLMTLAKASAGSGEHAAALERIEDALRLWRGEPLAEFADLDFAGVEADRLRELRLVAAEYRADCLLHLGRHAEGVAEIEAVVRSSPTRERAVELLMRALYVAGRQSDALAAYHDLRHRLEEELGVDPAEPARTTYQRILTQDPALALPHARGNLPRRGTELVGRRDEPPRVGSALRDRPMVTLTGVGGVGKSRLALEVATQLRSGFPDGVWLCELAPLSPGGPVGQAVAVALRVQQRQGMTIEETLIEYLRHRRLLLVLDNCEHVLDAAAELVEQVVQQCPDIAVLATSREPLGIGGEQLWPVAPLAAADAHTLFVQRAQADRPGFRPDRDESEAIAEICRRVDGLPLAIELAAARMRAMSAAEIARRLDAGGLLSGGPRTSLRRHQSLAAAIDWSYQLLSEPEQRLFERLSVFAGGCDLAGAHAVCAEPGTRDDETLDLLTRLVDKSLVTVTSLGGHSRYHLLETLRAHGRGLLRATGASERLGRRHAAYFTRLAEAAARGLQGAEERAWVERVLPDYDNLRTAFELAAADRDAELALRLVTSLPELVHLRVGYEAAGWSRQILELATPDHPLYPAAAGYAARGAWNRGDFPEALSFAARAGGRTPRLGTGRPAFPADVIADVALYEGDVDTALRHYDGEVRRARQDDDPIRLVWTLYYFAVCHAARRTPELGLAAADEAVRVADDTANPTARSMARYALGLVLKKADPRQALALLDRAGELADSVHNFWWHGIALMEAAATRGVHGDPAAASRAFVDVLDHWDRVGDRTQQWLNLRYVVRLLVRLGADEDAVVLHHCLLAADKPSPLAPARLATLLDGPGGELFDSAAERGAALSLADAVSVARTLLRRH